MIDLKMASKSFFLILITMCNLTVALSESPVSCYKLEPGTVAGIISADVILTLLIVTATYYCARNQRRKTERADKVYMNVRARNKT